MKFVFYFLTKGSILGVASTKFSGVKTGATFSEKLRISINKLLKRTILSGVLLLIYENNFTGR